MFESIIIELTNYCNFKCPFCPSNSINRPKGYLDISLMDKILDEISSKKLAKNVQFGLMGEPFLHKQLFDMLDLAKKYKVKIRLFTNGSFFSDENINRVLNSGPNELYISYRAIEETGFSLNSQFDFKTYNQQIKKILLKASVSNTLDKLVLKVFKKSLYTKLINTGKMTEDLKAEESDRYIHDFLEFLSSEYSFSQKQFVVNHDTHLTSNLFIRFETIAKWNTIEISGKNNFKNGYIGACDGLNTHFGILWNGNVTTCCKDYEGQNMLGTLKEQSICEVLNGSVAQKIQKSLKYCYLPTEYCRICRGGETYLQSFLHQAGSIAAYKIPLLKNKLLNL